MSSAITLLAIETATSNCSVALHVAGETICQNQDGSNVHSQVLLDMVNDVLSQANVSRAQLDAIAVGQGPGSFTGLRIGVGVAQGLAYGVNCPMIGVSSLDVLANMAGKIPEPQSIVAGIDARMGEIYWCEYQRVDGVLNRQSPLRVTAPEQIVLESSGPLHLVGNAWPEYAQRLPAQVQSALSHGEPQPYPSAASLAELAIIAFDQGDTISPIEFAPEYVRNDVAKKSTKTVTNKR